MRGGILTISRKLWQNLRWFLGTFRYRSRYFYRRWILVLAVLAMVAVEVGSGQIVDGCAALVYQGKPNRVPCYKWPTTNEIHRILEDRSDVVRQIEAVEPGGATVRVVDWSNARRPLKCPGKGFLEIYYPGYREMRAVKAIIGDRKYLFGVPYRMWSY